MTNIKDIHIAIAGSGMGGLATALALAKKGFTHIEVYETASNLGFVGAGIQYAPNMVRILDRLGCWTGKDIQKQAVQVKETTIRQGETDKELAHVDMRYIPETFGYPHMVGHRSSLAGGMYEGCLEQKAIKFIFSSAIESVERWGPKPKFTVKPRDGETYTVEPHVLLASDGIKSVVREQMLEDLKIDAKIVDTNQSAYRIMLNRDQMEHDPELLELIDYPGVRRWIGEKKHIIAYPIAGNTIYNLSTAHPDTHFAAAPSATYTTKGDKAALFKVYGDFCPVVQKMLNLVPEGEVCEWRLRVHAPLPTWVHGSVALVGDACHPTLPHLNQGAAQAIEDGAVLGEVLAKLPDLSGESITKTLKVYEVIRKDRAYALVDMAAASGRALHLGAGEDKEERDRQFAALKEKKGSVPDKWADKDVQKLIYGHDCMMVAQESFDELFAKC